MDIIPYPSDFASSFFGSWRPIPEADSKGYPKGMGAGYPAPIAGTCHAAAVSRSFCSFLRPSYREALSNQSLPISLQELLQISDLFLQLTACIRVPYQLSLRYPLNDNAVRVNIALLLYGSLRRLKGIVGCQNKAIGIVNQGISRNPRLLLVRLGKASINYKHLSPAFHWIFPIL